MTTEVVEESLERIAEAYEQHRAREERDDDAEVALDELIGVLSDIRYRPHDDDSPIRPDEFVCRSCRMAMHRSLLADAEGEICLECFVPGRFGF